jgi:GNAT superfamily N-acetyltransferase
VQVGLVSAFRPQDTSIYRPYPDEIPWELLRIADADENRVYDYVDADYMRVAKYADEPVGVYVIRSLTPTSYELCNLSIDAGFRNKGLGRWLLGHAIGLAETKGGREMLVRDTPMRGLFRQVGFVTREADLLFTLTPE